MPSVDKTTAGSPVELENPGRLWHWSAVKSQCLVRGVRGSELDKAIASVAEKKLLAESLGHDAEAMQRLVMSSLDWTRPSGRTRC